MHHRSSASRPVRAGLALTAALAAVSVPPNFGYSAPVTTPAAAETAAVVPVSGAVAAELSSARVVHVLAFGY